MVRLRHKIGQMLIMGFSGCEIDGNSPVVEWLQKDGLGGVLLFDYDLPKKCYGKNLRNKEQIRQLTKQLNHFAEGEKDKLPLFIAIDYEGGAVDRLARIDGCITTIKASEQALLSNEALYQEAERMAISIQQLGFNLNFAPVVDLNLNEHEGIIGKRGRSFSADANVVIRAAQQFVKAFSAHGIVCAYKHFPGHGSACGDTHNSFVDVTEQYHENELLPYKSLLNDPALPEAMVMTAHVINRHLDDSQNPATLSSATINNLLRLEIGFDGVVISDDMQMQAISDHYTLDESIRLTINAGADMLIFGNQLGYITATEVINRIETLVESGAIASSRIEQAYQRISRLKQSQMTLIYT